MHLSEVARDDGKAFRVQRTLGCIGALARSVCIPTYECDQSMSSQRKRICCDGCRARSAKRASKSSTYFIVVGAQNGTPISDHQSNPASESQLHTILGSDLSQPGCNL